MAKKRSKELFRDIRRILMCFIAGIIMSANINTFVHTGNLLPGGFAGVTILIQNVFSKFLKISIPYGPVYILLNLGPAILGYLKIGKKFTIYSGVTILTVAFFTDILPSHAITYDVLLISVFGGIINGLAVSLCLFAGATSGGTDFISIFISEKFNVDAWNYILIFNAVVLALDGALFGWSKALYSIIFQFVSTQIINTLYKRYKKNTLFIVTDHPQEIADIIYSETRHGATMLDVTGTYQDTPKKMLYSVISTEELNRVLNEISGIDENAFINVMRTEQVEGHFHMQPKD